MNVRKLGDAKTLKDFGQGRQADAPTNDFHVKPTVEKPVAGSHEWRGTYKEGSLLKEPTAGGRRRIEHDGVWLESNTAGLHSLTRLTIHPSCGTGRAVCRPEGNH